MKTKLYRHFDKEGRLLYVGISQSAIVRLAQHKQTASWFDEVTTVTIENFETRELALAAEEQAIKAERPLYNLQHSQDTWAADLDAEIEEDLCQMWEASGTPRKEYLKAVREGSIPANLCIVATNKVEVTLPTENNNA